MAAGGESKQDESDNNNNDDVYGDGNQDGDDIVLHHCSGFVERKIATHEDKLELVIETIFCICHFLLCICFF